MGPGLRLLRRHVPVLHLRALHDVPVALPARDEHSRTGDGAGTAVAAVVQAQPNAGQHEVKGLLMEFATSVVKSAGNELGQDAANGLAGWSN